MPHPADIDKNEEKSPDSPEAQASDPSSPLSFQSEPESGERDAKAADLRSKRRGRPADRPQKQTSKSCMTVFLIGVVIFVCLAILFTFMLIGVMVIDDIPEIQTLSSSSPILFNEEFIAGDRKSANKIVVIEIEGVILQGASTFYKVADATAITEQIKYVKKQRNIKGVIVKLNTPGGEVVASDIIHHQISQLKKEKDVPIIACMGSVAASGGYYVAVACDFIVANRLTTTGSIGVIIHSYAYYDLLNKIGVHTNTFKSGPMKDILSGTRPVSPAENIVLQELVDETYEEFVRLVAEGRKGLTVDKIKDSAIGDGRVFSGKQALMLGLVDQLGFFEDAVKATAQRAKVGKDYKVIRYQRTFTFSQLLLGAKSNQKPISDKVSVQFPGTNNWTSCLEPGKMYFLPAW